jgi:hypothetical protein
VVWSNQIHGLAKPVHIPLSFVRLFLTCGRRAIARTITFRPKKEQGEFNNGMIESGDFANQSEVIPVGI